MDILKFQRNAEVRINQSRSPAAFLFRAAAKAAKIRPLAVRAICRLEGGQMWSTTFRELMRDYYGVEIGMHSYGPPLLPGGLPRGTRVGNYCSFASGVEVFRRNHPMDRLSQHPFFFNAVVGLLDSDTIQSVEDNPLTIGHDVWIGQNVIIAPSCRMIGNGAMIASGAVVTTDVPALAIVGGVPARLIRWRFPEELQAAWMQSRWWLKPITELGQNINTFLEPLQSDIFRHFDSAVGSRSTSLEHNSAK